MSQIAHNLFNLFSQSLRPGGTGVTGLSPSVGADRGFRSFGGTSYVTEPSPEATTAFAPQDPVLPPPNPLEELIGQLQSSSRFDQQAQEDYQKAAAMRRQAYQTPVPRPVQPAFRSMDLLGLLGAFDPSGQFLQGFMGAKQAKDDQDTQYGQQAFQTRQQGLLNEAEQHDRMGALARQQGQDEHARVMDRVNLAWRRQQEAEENRRWDTGQRNQNFRSILGDLGNVTSESQIEGIKAVAKSMGIEKDPAQLQWARDGMRDRKNREAALSLAPRLISAISKDGAAAARGIQGDTLLRILEKYPEIVPDAVWLRTQVEELRRNTPQETKTLGETTGVPANPAKTTAPTGRSRPLTKAERPLGTLPAAGPNGQSVTVRAQPSRSGRQVKLPSGATVTIGRPR
jgi:hypothetical protein